MRTEESDIKYAPVLRRVLNDKEKKLLKVITETSNTHKAALYCGISRTMVDNIINKGAATKVENIARLKEYAGIVNKMLKQAEK